MTKKHLIKFAEQIKLYVENRQYDEAWAIFKTVVLVTDNPLFNYVKFKEACGMTTPAFLSWLYHK